MKIPKFCLPYVKDPLLLYENRAERKVSAHTFITYVSIILSLPAFCAGYIIAHSQQIVDHLFLFHDIPTDWKVTVNSVYQQIKRGDKADQYSVQPMYDQQYESNISYFYFSLYFGLVIGSLVSFIPCDMVGRKKTMLYSILSTILMITVYMIFLSEDAVGKGELYVIRFLLGSSQSFLLISSMLYIVEISAVYNRGKNLSWIPIQFILGKLVCSSLFSLHIVINASSHSFLNFGWYSTLVPVILLCGVMFYCCIFFPESPRWLLAMKTPTDCSEALKVYRRETSATSAGPVNQKQRNFSNPSDNQSHQHGYTPAVSAIKEEFSLMYRALSTDARLDDTLIDLLSNQTISIRLGQCIGMSILTAAVLNPDWLCSYGFHLYLCITQAFQNSSGGSTTVSARLHAIRLGLCGLILLLIISSIGGFFARARIDERDGRRNIVLRVTSSIPCMLGFTVLGSLLLLESKRLGSSEEHHHAAKSSVGSFSWIYSYMLHVSIWIAACTCVYFIGNGIECLQFVYGLEIFPYRARAKMVSLWIAFFFLINGIVSQYYVASLFDIYSASTSLSWNSHETFDSIDTLLIWLQSFGKILLIIGGIIYPFVLFSIYVSLPETSGVFLEDVEGLFNPQNLSYCCSLIPFISQHSTSSNTVVGWNSNSYNGNFASGGYLMSSAQQIHPQPSMQQNPNYVGASSLVYGSPTEVELKNMNRSNINRPFASPIYEPSSLHKYSHGMKESKFLFFSPSGTGIPNTGVNSASRLNQEEGMGRFASYGLTGESVPLTHQLIKDNVSVSSGNSSTHGFGNSSNGNTNHFCPSDCDEEVDDGLIVKPFTIDFGK